MNEPLPRWRPADTLDARGYLSRLVDVLERVLARKQGADQDIELVPVKVGSVTRQQRLILRSPNGNRWYVTVDDAGQLAAAPAD